MRENDNMEYDLEELLTAAIMLDKPIILVEGSDDIKLYENLLNNINKECDVYAIENVDSYSEGCDEVIRAIKDIQNKINENPHNERYILGIIDADVRPFRNEIPKIKGLFVLKYYSFESHFITRSNLKKLISEITCNGNKSISEELLDYCESDLEKRFKELYYYSLEALKNSVTNNYNSIVVYSDNAGMLYSNYHLSKIKAKKRTHDYFANKHSLKYNLISLKSIAKGKWLLFYYSSSILSKLKNLKDACKNKLIAPCQFCKKGNYNKCLRKLNGTYDVKQVQNKLLNIYDRDELKYIYDRFNLLGSYN